MPLKFVNAVLLPGAWSLECSGRVPWHSDGDDNSRRATIKPAA